MLFGLWRRPSSGAPSEAARPNRFRPQLEQVEERLAPATVHYVNSGFYGGGVVRFSVPLAAGATVVANVRATNPGAPSSQQFDPIVGLFGPSGNLITSNDDAGTGSHWAARITYTARQAGTYTIGITHYSDFQVVGTPTQSGPHPGLDTGAFVLDTYVTTTRHWSVKDRSVHIPPHLAGRIDQIANAYYARTHKNLVITDGKRLPGEQAQAIYNKIVGDGVAAVRRLYLNQTLINQIIAAYRNNTGQAAKLRAMTATIQAQVNRGQYISRHLSGNGFDVRSRDMTAADRQAFVAAVTAAGGRLINEGGSQPHFHVQF
jgi:hypothetical protein